MIQRIEKISFFIIIFVQLCCLNFTKAVLDNVKMKVRTTDGIIELNWQRTEQHLANRYLPVWQIIRDRGPVFLPHIMNGIGDFITYYDLEKSSAVVYFMKFDCVYGVIDSRYYLIQVPMSEIDPNKIYDIDNHHIFMRRSNENERFFRDNEQNLLSNVFSDDELQYINSLIDFDNAQSAPPSDNYNTPSSSMQNGIHTAPSAIRRNFAPNNHHHAVVLYPEILVFITYDIYEEFSRIYPNKGVSLLVMYYIVYFNAISMLFSQLSTHDIKVSINIAGVVVETNRRILPYSIVKSRMPDESSIYRFREREFSHSFPIYLKQYRELFPEDSFDFYFVATSYAMYKHGIFLNGVSNSKVDIFKQRSINQPCLKVLGSIVTRTKAFGDYITGARQIARLMDIGVDIRSEGRHSNNEQCFAIMQQSRNYCHDCLKWSDSSRHDLGRFVRYNRNSCFVLNFPRSLFPYGHLVFSRNPEDQCLCYQFPMSKLNPLYISSIPQDSCSQPMICSYDQDEYTFTPMPLDGTPCGGVHSVCWRGQCVRPKVPSTPDHFYGDNH